MIQMKCALILLSFMAIVSNNLHNTIKGLYHDINNSMNKVLITDDRFYYMESEAGWSNDTLAVCSWIQIDDQFIEIKLTENYADLPFKNMNVSTAVDSCLSADSIRFVFSIPYTKSELNIVISGTQKGFSKQVIEMIVYSKDKSEFVFPNNWAHIDYIQITPRENKKEHASFGRFYGLSEFTVYFRKDVITQNINVCIINIPLHNSYFEKYYIKNCEYVRVHNDTISWKGRTFVKRK